MGSLSKIDIQTKSSFRKTRKFLKHKTSKTIRRLGKKFLDDAPTKVRQVTKGWIS